MQKFIGPFRVVRRISDLTYVIRIISEEGGYKDDTTHVRRLMRYVPRKNKILPPLVETEPENTSDEDDPPPPPPRKRGRPRKPESDKVKIEEKPKRPVGRPRKECVG